MKYDTTDCLLLFWQGRVLMVNTFKHFLELKLKHRTFILKSTFEVEGIDADVFGAIVPVEEVNLLIYSMWSFHYM